MAGCSVENTGVRTLPRKATTLAELLRRAGIATAAITENGAIDRSRGFARGDYDHAEVVAEWIGRVLRAQPDIDVGSGAIVESSEASGRVQPADGFRRGIAWASNRRIDRSGLVTDRRFVTRL